MVAATMISLGQWEIVGAIIGSAFAVGMPAFRAAQRTGRNVDAVGADNMAAHSLLLDLIGGVTNSIDTFRDKFDEHANRNRADFELIRERLDKIEATELIVEARLNRIEGRLDRIEGRLDRIEGRLDVVEDEPEAGE